MTEKDNDSALAGAHLDTLAVRAGIARTHEGEHSEPIFLTSSYIFDSAAEAAERFSGDQPGQGRSDPGAGRPRSRLVLPGALPIDEIVDSRFGVGAPDRF